VTLRGRRFKDGLGGSTDSQGLALSRAKPRSRARQRAAVGTLAVAAPLFLTGTDEGPANYSLSS
jgi:hypothetical protein